MNNRNLGLSALLASVLAAGCSAVSVHVIDDANGIAVEGASVAWTDVSNRSGNSSTDWHGEAILLSHRPIQSIRVTKDGYKPASRDVKSDLQMDEAIEVRLVPVGGEASGFER